MSINVADILHIAMKKKFIPVPRLMTIPSSVADLFIIMAASTLRPLMLSGTVAASALNA